MLTRLTRRLRFRAALALAALYACCILMPMAAFAFGNGTAHCLTEAAGPAHVHKANAHGTAHRHGDGALHVHPAKDAVHAHGDHAAPHDHADKSDTKPAGTCCGLFCVSALALGEPDLLGLPLAATRTAAARDYALAGRDPDRITRPPIR